MPVLPALLNGTLSPQFVQDLCPHLDVWEADPPASLDDFQLLKAIFQWCMTAKHAIRLLPRIADLQARVRALRKESTMYQVSLKPDKVLVSAVCTFSRTWQAVRHGGAL